MAFYLHNHYFYFQDICAQAIISEKTQINKFKNKFKEMLCYINLSNQY